MRQIKFRAWVKSGDYSEMLSNVQNHIGAATGFGHLIQGTAKGVDESHVMQFTGLTDFDGVEIYEGDIVRLFGFICCIKWEDSDASFMAVERHDSWAESGQEWSSNCTVIGNIYQNPELLK